jgi:hypothetical protein
MSSAKNAQEDAPDQEASHPTSGLDLSSGQINNNSEEESQTPTPASTSASTSQKKKQE